MSIIFDGDNLKGIMLDGEPIKRVLWQGEELWANPAMLLTFEVTTNLNVMIPLQGNINIMVDWGDGSVTTHTANDPTHAYASAGTYNVIVTGTAESLGQGLAGWYENVVAMHSFGMLGLTTLSSSFERAAGLVVMPPTIPAGITDTQSMFRDAIIFNGNISGWDMSQVFTLNNMFLRAREFNQDISGWDTGSVKGMASVFNFATNFDQSLGGWDVRNATNMASLLNYTALSTQNYDATLIGWAAQDVQSNVPFSAGNAQYSPAAAAARSILLGKGWTITDGGPA